MKSFQLLLGIIIFSLHSIHAQCIADTGKDTTICVGLYGLDTIYLGGASTAQYGTPPYSYTWSCDYWVAGTLHFTASDFLDDTTVANPRIIDYITAPDILTFRLNVKDSIGLVCSDSIKIRFSSFGYILAGYNLYMNKGDSIAFLGESFVGNGIPPLLYTWTPTDGIADIHDLSTKLSPDTTTHYAIYAIDAVGCTSEISGAYTVFVSPTSVNEQYNNASDLFNIYPNPVNDYIIIDFKNLHTFYKKVIKIYTLTGEILQELNISENKNDLQINTKNIPAGIYILHLADIKNSFSIAKKIKISHQNKTL